MVMYGIRMCKLQEANNTAWGLLFEQSCSLNAAARHIGAGTPGSRLS